MDSLPEDSKKKKKDRPGIIKRRGKTFAFLLGFAIATILIVFYLNIKTSNIPAFEESWHFYAGIALLISFLPFTFVSYRTLRLPKKEDEHEKIMANLKKVGIKDAQTLVVTDMKYSQWDYALPLLFVTIFSMMAFCVLFCKNAELLLSGSNLLIEAQEKNQPQVPGLLAMLMAFLGAYIWSIRYILRRLVTIDLPPAAYYGVGVRMVLSTFVSLIFYYFISALPSGDLMSGEIRVDIVPDESMMKMLPVIAFLIGIFPQRALTYMAERFKFSASRPEERALRLPLDLLEGITPYHKERFFEQGIDNVQNLVKASLIELIIHTPFKPRELIDWILQGRLCLQFKTDASKLRAAGVRTILGFKIIGDEGRLDRLAETTGLSIAYLENAYSIIKESPAIKRLKKAKDCLHSI